MTRVEMVVRLLTGSSEHGPNNVFQQPDQKDVLQNGKDSALGTVSSHRDFNFNQNKNDDTRSNGTIGDRDLSKLSSNFDRQTHAHHNHKIEKTMHDMKQLKIGKTKTRPLLH